MTQTRDPKHREISDFLRAEISSGRYPSLARLPSESALVGRFSVSRPTVIRALRDLQAEGLIDRRAGSGSFVKPQAATPVLGLVVPGLGHTEIFEPICAGIVHEAQRHRMSVWWGGMGTAPTHAGPPPTDLPDPVTESLCEQYIARRVAGVFFAPLELIPESAEVNRQILARLEAAGIAAVLLDRDIAAIGGRSRFDVVGIDNFAAGYRLTTHLIEQGARKFRFVARADSASTVDLRLAGARECLIRNGLDASELAAVGDPADLAFIRSLIPKSREGSSPPALVCANDFTAALLMQSLAAMNVRVPDDARVVGFDDVKYARLLPVPLTTMRQPCERLGAAAAQAMAQRLADPSLPARTILLPAELVVRRSCGASAADPT